MKINSTYITGHWVRHEGQAAYEVQIRDVGYFKQNGWHQVARRPMREHRWSSKLVDGAVLIPPSDWPESKGEDVVLEVDRPSREELMAFVADLWHKARAHTGKFWGVDYSLDAVTFGGKRFLKFDLSHWDFPYWIVRVEGPADEEPQLLRWEDDHWLQPQPKPQESRTKKAPRPRKPQPIDPRGVLPLMMMHHEQEREFVKTELGDSVSFVKDQDHYSVVVQVSSGRWIQSEDGVLEWHKALYLTDWAIDRAVEALTEIEAWGVGYRGSACEFHAVPMTRPQAVRLKKLLAEIIASPLGLYSLKPLTLSPGESIADIKLERRKTKRIEGQVPAGFDWEAFDKD